MLPFGIPLVTYIAAGGFMWFVAHLLAPVGYSITLGRGVGTVFVMGVVDTVSSAFLKPFVGDWMLLITLVSGILVARSMLGLTLGRSAIAVVSYWVAMILGYYLLFILPTQRQRSARLENEAPFTCSVEGIPDYQCAMLSTAVQQRAV